MSPVEHGTRHQLPVPPASPPEPLLRVHGRVVEREAEVQQRAVAVHQLVPVGRCGGQVGEREDEGLVEARLHVGFDRRGRGPLPAEAQVQLEVPLLRLGAALVQLHEGMGRQW